jgi:hypothetical protein
LTEPRILKQGPGYTIAQTDEASTLVPYFAVKRQDGNQNHGFIDLRGRSDLVDQVPEARKSTGLATLLKVIADPSSQLMSGGCECHAFENVDNPDRPRWTAGCYVTVMFQETERNRVPASLHDVAAYSLNGIAPPPEGTHFGFEFLIEPLKTFFGMVGCYSVMMKPLGYGSTRDEAWAAMNSGLEALAASISRDRKEKVEPRL